jgi:hypothetical protein
MTADLADRVDDVGAHLLRDLLQLLVVELAQVGGGIDPAEQGLSLPLPVIWLLRSVAHLFLVKM